MSDQLPPSDPFNEGDPEAAERERRRLEREARRKSRGDRKRGERSRRSLADLVGGVSGGGSDREPADGEPPPDARGAEPPPADDDARGVEPTERPFDPETDPGTGAVDALPPEEELPFEETPAFEQPAAEQPTRAQPIPPDDDEDWAVGPLPGPGPRAARHPDDPAEELGAPEINVRPKPTPTPRPAVSEPHLGWRERLAGGGHPGPPTNRAVVLRRRLLAGGAMLGAILVVVLLVKAVGGGEEAPPVAAPEPVATTDFLVPEGLTIEQIGDLAKKAKLKGSYEKAVKKAAKSFPLKRYDAQDAASMEGFLFPATYELEKGASAKDLVAKQLDAFQQNFDSVDLKRAEKKNLTPYDVLTIASMIEKEIQVPKERPLAAAVIYNRLSAGDTLGIDATLRYELGNYDEQLLQSELDAATPYNSRINPGLPPTPIANPGLASIEAAADPAKSDVYFFVVKPGTCGEHEFTADAAEFAAAQARYEEALAAEGGSPTDCS